MKTTLAWGAAFGAVGIILGALGAHALKSILTAEQLHSFEIGVRYQMYHALFLLVIAGMQRTHFIKGLNLVRNLTIAGVFCFSFSIYLLNLQDTLGVKLSFLGPVTPLGGLLLIAAWAILLGKGLKASKRE